MADLLELPVERCVLGSLYPGGNGGGALLLLGVLHLLGLRLQTLPEVLGLALDVPRHAAVFLHHAEATHGGHQCLLLLAEREHLRVGAGWTRGRRRVLTCFMDDGGTQMRG